MELWGFLWILAVVILVSLVLHFKPKREKLFQMAKIGSFVAGFDWVFETIGFELGYWTVGKSVFMLGRSVPAEVSIIAFCTGAVLNLLFTSKFSLQKAILTSLPIGLVGATFEILFIENGLMTYGNGWTSLYAFITYSAVFVLFQFVNNGQLVKNS